MDHQQTCKVVVSRLGRPKAFARTGIKQSGGVDILCGTNREGGAEPTETIDGSPADVQGSRLAIGSTDAFVRTGIKQSVGMNV